MNWAPLALLLTAFPSVQVNMTKGEALAALKQDGLAVCETTALPESDPLLGGAVTGLLACRQCPCPPHLGSLIIWLGKTDRVTGISIVEPKQPRPEQPRPKQPKKKAGK